MIDRKYFSIPGNWQYDFTNPLSESYTYQPGVYPKVVGVSREEYQPYFFLKKMDHVPGLNLYMEFKYGTGEPGKGKRYYRLENGSNPFYAEFLETYMKELIQSGSYRIAAPKTRRQCRAINFENCFESLRLPDTDWE